MTDSHGQPWIVAAVPVAGSLIHAVDGGDDDDGNWDCSNWQGNKHNSLQRLPLIGQQQWLNYPDCRHWSTRSRYEIQWQRRWGRTSPFETLDDY